MYVKMKTRLTQNIFTSGNVEAKDDWFKFIQKKNSVKCLLLSLFM